MKDFSQTCNEDTSRLRHLMGEASRLNYLMAESSRPMCGSSRLCRLMCEKASPFRSAPYFYSEAMPQKSRARQSLASSKSQLAERLSLSAHQAAQPRRLALHSWSALEATKGV
jgi:hypothetical protein